MADGQSTSQLQRRLRRAGLPNLPEHRQGATAFQEADHAASHQDRLPDASTTYPRTARTHSRHPPDPGSVRDAAACAAHRKHSSANQHPRALHQAAIRNRLERAGRRSPRAGIAEIFVRSAELRKHALCDCF